MTHSNLEDENARLRSLHPLSRENLDARSADNSFRFAALLSMFILFTFAFSVTAGECRQKLKEEWTAAYAAAQSGNVEEAQRLFLELLSEAKKTGEPETVVDSIKFNLANTYCQQMQEEKAIPLLLEVEKHYDEFGKDYPDPEAKRCYGYAVSKLGSIASDRGDATEAERLFKKAIVISRSSGGQPDPLSIQNNMANAYIKVGQWSKAEDLLRSLIKEHKRAGTDNQAAYDRAEVLLASCCLKQKEYAEAEKHIRIGLKLWKQLGGQSKLGEGMMQRILADSLWFQNKPMEAIPIYEEALILLRKSHLEPDKADLPLIRQSNSNPELNQALANYSAALKAAHQEMAASKVDEELERLKKEQQAK